MFKRITYFTYGIISYAVFFASFLYAIGFVGNLLVPKTLDGEPTVSLTVALLTNLGLLALFAVQHSVMARPAFKRWWTQYVPKPVERSTYTLFSSIALIALFYFWQPMGGIIWDVTDQTGQALLYGAFGFGWLLVLYSTFLINHFDLFGLRQVWLHLIGRKYTALKFKTPSLYKSVRHPMYIGWFFAFWGTPTMSVTHLLFAVMTTAYILIAIQLEERDLVTDLPEYKDYRKRVPMLIPRFNKQLANTAATRTEQA